MAPLIWLCPHEVPRPCSHRREHGAQARKLIRLDGASSGLCFCQTRVVLPGYAPITRLDRQVGRATLERHASTIVAWRRQTSSIGLDLGKNTIRLLQLSSKGDGLSVIAAAHAPAEAGQVDPVDRINANADLIKKLLSTGAFIGRRVTTALPIGATRIKSFRLPCIPDEELDDAVRFEALERFQSLDEEPEIRYFKAGRIRAGQGDQFELIVVATPGALIRAHISALEDIGLVSHALDFTPSAAFRPFERFLKREEDAGDVNTFLDIGYEGSRLVITAGSEVAFTKAFDIGVAAFEEAIAKALSVDSARARELYEDFVGDADPPAPESDSREGPAILDALGGVVEQLGKELNLCRRYFSVTFRGLHSESITCVGGGSRNPVLLARLSESIGDPARAGHPLLNISSDSVFPGPDRRGGQPEWATVVGLAMKGLRSACGVESPVRKAVAV